MIHMGHIKMRKTWSCLSGADQIYSLITVIQSWECYSVSLVMSDSCNPMDCSLPGSSVHGIFQARVLEWVAISFSPIGLGLNIMTSFNLVHVRAKVTSVVSDSVRPHRQQPTRLLCPWDSPGKNTGVSCYFLLQCMKSEKWKGSCSVVPDS